MIDMNVLVRARNCDSGQATIAKVNLRGSSSSAGFVLTAPFPDAPSEGIASARFQRKGAETSHLIRSEGSHWNFATSPATQIDEKALSPQ